MFGYGFARSALSSSEAANVPAHGAREGFTAFNVQGLWRLGGSALRASVGGVVRGQPRHRVRQVSRTKPDGMATCGARSGVTLAPIRRLARSLHTAADTYDKDKDDGRIAG